MATAMRSHTHFPVLPETKCSLCPFYPVISISTYLLPINYSKNERSAFQHLRVYSSAKNNYAQNSPSLSQTFAPAFCLSSFSPFFLVSVKSQAHTATRRSWWWSFPLILYSMLPIGHGFTSHFLIKHQRSPWGCPPLFLAPFPYLPWSLPGWVRKLSWGNPPYCAQNTITISATMPFGNYLNDVPIARQ